MFNFYGFPISPNDMRALSEDELQKAQYANMRAAQNYTRSPDEEQKYIEGLRPYRLPESRPLNERFEDFKVRLAAAVAKIETAT
jgi:hypothetical protein